MTTLVPLGKLSKKAGILSIISFATAGIGIWFVPLEITSNLLLDNPILITFVKVICSISSLCFCYGAFVWMKYGDS